MVANVPGSVPAGRRGDPERAAARLRREPESRLRALQRRALLAANPDAVPEPGAVAALARLHGRAPALRRRRARDDLPRRLAAAVAAALPDGDRHARPPHAAPQLSSARSATSTSTSRPDEPVQADWMLGGFLLLRRAMLDELGGLDEGFRLYGEDIDLQYRAMRAGWERWYVPAAVVRHEHQAETDKRFLTRRTLWHWRGIAALRPQAPGEAARAVSEMVDKYDDLADGFSEVEYADPERYAERRARR